VHCGWTPCRCGFYVENTCEYYDHRWSYGYYNLTLIQIIEDGPGTRDKPVHVQPARYFGNLVDPNSKTLLRHQGRPSEALGGRSPVVPAGRCLGGGSGVNCEQFISLCTKDHL